MKDNPSGNAPPVEHLDFNQYDVTTQDGRYRLKQDILKQMRSKLAMTGYTASCITPQEVRAIGRLIEQVSIVILIRWHLDTELNDPTLFQAETKVAITEAELAQLRHPKWGLQHALRFCEHCARTVVEELDDMLRRDKQRQRE